MIDSLPAVEWVIVALAGLFAGAMNAVAGGGTFFTFPALLLGMPPVVANATSKVGLWIGSLGSIKAYLPEIRSLGAGKLPLYAATILGSVAGSLLLMFISNEQFMVLVPYLLLFATLSFALAPWLRRGIVPGKTVKISSFLQGCIGVYAGFFGAGIGIYMLALFRWMGMGSVHQMNALKVLCAALAHTVSAIILITAGLVDWHSALILMLSAGLGGYGGAYLARSLPERLIHALILGYGFLISGYFFFA